MKYIYDLETYCNFFLACFYDISNDTIIKYEISNRRDDKEELHKFLLTQPKLIGFNNINFDYPVLHNTILTKPLNTINARLIYEEAGRVINTKYSAIWDNQIIVPQLDLFKIWHYDNKNKSTSLKWLEFAMRSKDVRDLPYPPNVELTSDQMDEITDYCIHDVMETYKFFTKSIRQIQIRESYSVKENINLMNSSEIAIAKEVIAKKLSNPMGMEPWEIKKLRTYRDTVAIKDIIFDYIHFNDPLNKKVLDYYTNAVWINTDEMSDKKKKELALKFQIPYKNVIRDYAEGGLHSFGETGIYESNDTHVLVDVDFASFYPHISFKNNLHPEHIPGEIFNSIYEGFYEERKKYPKSDPVNYVLKIVLNGAYGLSKDKYSLLYDPKWQLSITVNGQLLLTLLTEKIIEYCEKEVKIVFENTDGAMYYIARSDLDKVRRACKQVEDICRIPLEIQECKKIIARDVNNYINIIDDGYYKFKGAFEIDRDYHKNHSKRIVPIALANYFINGVLPEYTIYNHLEGTEYNFAENYGIYDFLLCAKMTGNNVLYKRELKHNSKFGIPAMREFVTMHGYQQLCRNFYVKDKKGALLKDVFDILYEDSTLKEDTKLHKTTRYYISNNGYQLIKKMPYLKSKLNAYKNNYLRSYTKRYPNDTTLSLINEIDIILPHRETNIESEWLCTLANKIEEKDDYDINYTYYINECYKIINLYDC